MSCLCGCPVEDTKDRRNSSSSQENPNSVSDIARLEEMIRERGKFQMTGKWIHYTVDIIIDELFKQIHGLKADLDYIKALVDQRVHFLQHLIQLMYRSTAQSKQAEQAQYPP